MDFLKRELREVACLAARLGLLALVALTLVCAAHTARTGLEALGW